MPSVPVKTIAVDEETHAKAKRLMHARELESLGAAVACALDESLSHHKATSRKARA